MLTTRSSKSESFFNSKTEVSEVKHGVLKRYLGAWIPILHHNKHRNRHQSRISQYTKLVYVDGFAGPGKYENGDNGSPLIALELALGIKNLKRNGPEICLIFIEKKLTFANMLLENLNALRNEKNWPNKATVKFLVISGEFAPSMELILSTYFEFPPDNFEQIFTLTELANNATDTGSQFVGNNTPLLVFADPFGYHGKHIPMSLMRQIMAASSKSEVIVNLMTGFIRRFCNLDSNTRAVNLLVGDHKEDATWKQIVLAEDGTKEKLKVFLEFYGEQLCKDTVKESYSCIFQMKDPRNVLLYSLYFACSHNKAFKEMKRAMSNKSQDDQDFKFSAFDAKNPDFEIKEIHIEVLTQRIVNEFKGKKVRGLDITNYIESDRWLFQHYRRPLKKCLSKYRVHEKGKESKKFDKLVFRFP